MLVCYMPTTVLTIAENARELFEAGRGLIVKGEINSALELLQRALVLYKDAGDERGVCNCLVQSGIAHLSLSDFTKALSFYRQVLDIGKQRGNVEFMCLAYGNIGQVLATQDNYPLAKENFELALSYALQLNPPKTLGALYNNLGVLHERAGNYVQALENYLQALRVWEQEINVKNTAITYLNIGAIYQHLENYKQAKENFDKCYALSFQADHKTMMARAVMGLGGLQLLKKDIDGAIVSLQVARNIAEPIGDMHSLTQIYNRLGMCYMDTGDYDNAIKFYNMATHTGQAADLPQNLLETEKNKGNTYQQLGQLDKAAECLLRCLSLATHIGNKKSKADILMALYELKKGIGHWEDALTYFEECVALRNEIRTADAEKQIANLKVGYDLELKEREMIAVERVLHNVLPQKIAARIRAGEEQIVERFSQASVLFADIVGFTSWSAEMDVNELAGHLDAFFRAFDKLAEKYGVEKIKTIGDSYMCASGLPEPCEDHAERMAHLALAMEEQMKMFAQTAAIELRIGIHTGEVVAGVIGANKYSYDLWGDTVNTASRMESHGIPGKIQVSDEFRNLLQHKFLFKQRGCIEVKGKGTVRTWFLEGAL